MSKWLLGGRGPSYCLKCRNNYIWWFKNHIWKFLKLSVCYGLDDFICHITTWPFFWLFVFTYRLLQVGGKLAKWYTILEMKCWNAWWIAIICLVAWLFRWVFMVHIHILCHVYYTLVLGQRNVIRQGPMQAPLVTISKKHCGQVLR